MPLQQVRDQYAVGDVAAYKGVARTISEASQVLGVSGVRQLVQGDDRPRPGPDPVTDEVAANEACPTSYQNLHEPKCYPEGHSWANLGLIAKRDTGTL
jgi:hypothetical protein